MNPFFYAMWRLHMAQHWPKIQALLPKSGRAVEIGVWRGGTSVRLLEQQPSWLGLVDPFSAKHDESWEGRVSQAYMARVKGRAVGRVAARDRGHVARWFMVPSVEAAPLVPDASLDFVYVDGDHSEAACGLDLVAWWPKVKPGGALVLDDHLTGRWWGADVIVAASNFRPEDEARRESLGRWLVIHKERV